MDEKLITVSNNQSKPSSGQSVSNNGSSMFLINKMFYNPNDKAQKDHQDSEAETEYSLYPEAKSMNK